MGFLKKALSAGAAKKVIEAARKPENQARMKSLASKARRRRGQQPPLSQ
ncbi:MAG: hypothetical protein H0T85_11135 [Geodermatophilaceae bacterium]|nr:hypothetical protein [Geodermatophilaceae bacterium]